MFWYKAWLETKFKFLLALGIMVFYLIVFYLMRTLPPPPGGRPANFPAFLFGMTATIFAVILYTWFAGAGIDTQPSFQATKGLHGSTLFTLSLPVSRLRLLTIRAGIGWLEMAGGILAWCYGLWLILRLGRSVSAVNMLQFVVALIVCASSLYFLSVLLGTFLDDQWRMYTTAMATGALWTLGTFVRLPASVNIVRAIMGESSPLVSHTMPWMPMLFSLVLAAAFFFAALKVAQLREY
jgi:hypothetical protein